MTTLPHIAFRVLVVLAGQFTGGNNGSLSLTRRTAAKHGIRNAHALFAALRELEARSLIERTRPGSRIPPRSAFFALTWRRVNAPLHWDPHDDRETLKPSNAWVKWQAPERKRNGFIWTVKKRAARWPVATSPSDACKPDNAETGGACEPAASHSRVAHGPTSQISPLGVETVAANEWRSH